MMSPIYELTLTIPLTAEDASPIVTQFKLSENEAGQVKVCCFLVVGSNDNSGLHSSTITV